MQGDKTTIDMNLFIIKKLKSSWFRFALFVEFAAILGVLVAYMISQGDYSLAIAATFLVPAVVVLSEHPFFGVLLWLLVMPFVSVLPNASLVYWILYRILPVFLLFLAILSRMLKVQEHPPARIVPPELAMGLLVLMVPSLILLFQTDPNLALIRFGDRMILPFCMYFVIRLQAPREREFRQLQWIALFLALSQSFIGFLSWYAPQFLPQAWLYLQGDRTTGSFRDPDLYAVVLTLCAVILIHGAVNQKSRLIRFIFFVTSCLCAIFVFFSFERAAWLAGVMVAIGLVFIYPKVIGRLFIIGSIVMLVLSMGFLSSHVSLSITRFTEADPIYDRIVIFDAMSQMFQEKPILGWGYETLDQNIRAYYRTVGEASITTRTVTSHNTYMTILTELGLVGFILYMFPVVWWFILSIKVWRRMPKAGLGSRPLLAILWLVMLFNFTVSNFMDMRWFEIGLVLWWLMLGFIANMVYPYLKNRDGINSAHIGLHESYA
jgi:O-antigen ligase